MCVRSREVVRFWEGPLREAPLYYIAHLKSSLYRNHRSQLPPMPESRANVHFDGEWTKTASGKDFLIAEDEDRLIMFATDGEHQVFVKHKLLYYC